MAIPRFLAAINQICEEKKLPRDIVIEAVKEALVRAYWTDYGTKGQKVEVEFTDSGDVRFFVIKEVVEKVEDPFFQISLEEAQKYNPNAKIGEEVKIENTPKEFGRIAAQKAKNLIIQRIREAEREIAYNEYKEKEDSVVMGIVQRVEGGTVYIDLGRAVGVMPAVEQIPHERYYPGQKLRTYVKRVEKTSRGPHILLSRADVQFLAKIFEMEIPEIPAGIVEIKSIAREPGSRSKVAVVSNKEEIDPVGSCVGQRGTRINAINAELSGEKIDIVVWDADPEVFIKKALSPAKVDEVKIVNKTKREAKVKVSPEQLSLAIGKGGQNVRLAAKLTGWKIDIEGAENIEGAKEGMIDFKEEGEEINKIEADLKQEAETINDSETTINNIAEQNNQSSENES